MSDDHSISIDLVRRAKSGDDDALDRLIRRYYDRVRRIVRMRMGQRLKSQVEIEDVLQETFIAAIETFDRFELRDDASLINWLAKLAERRICAAADYVSAKKRDRRREVRFASSLQIDDSSVISQEIADSISAPVDLAGQQELKRIVEECIASLDEGYRELILLREYARDGLGPDRGRDAAPERRGRAHDALASHARTRAARAAAERLELCAARRRKDLPSVARSENPGES